MATLTRVGGTVDVPDRLPVVALRDLVFFPYMVLPLLVGRPRSVASLEAAETGDGLLLLVAQKDAGVDEPGWDDLFHVGTVARAVQVTRLPDGTCRVVLEGIGRARALRPGEHEGGGFEASVEALTDREADPPGGRGADVEARARKVAGLFADYAELHERVPSDVAVTVAETRDRLRMAHLVAGHLLVPHVEKQPVLEATDLSEQLVRLKDLLVRELEILHIEEKLDQQIQLQLDSDRRQHYLTEQLKAIRRELGSEPVDEGDELEERLATTPLPDHARERAEREAGRLRKLNPVAPEAAVIRTYLDWILGLPWTVRTEDNLDVPHAARVLDEAHFGLDEVKERILDHIAVLSLVGELQGPILCLVGPPGVGKTSLGRSIARSLDREFVRVSLGGVRDEAEIRGHRRTYVGALPGRVIQGMRRSGSKNPVFLLDEVDKLARDFHGDPGAALLEVLDPEQNRTFTDHYLELEYDLSDVLFVATANTLQGIPDPLRDRMEVIRLPGYLDTEKRAIVRRFLWPKQAERHGLSTGAVTLDDAAVDVVIDRYTREAGVRELERRVGRIARKVAREVVEERSAPADASAGTDGRAGARETDEEPGAAAGGAAGGSAAAGDRAATEGAPAAGAPPRTVRADDLKDLLGPPPYTPPDREEGAERSGIANGLAWTAAGGEVLDVEVAVVPGTGEVRLTGTLGDVMKESAFAALTYARSRARRLGLDAQFHQQVDIHIHIPEGATPKDGPSAGITIAVALISALTDTPTRGDVALTGEITLRGRVLGVGGIKEKAVAALRNGMSRVVIPAQNVPELDLLPAEVREGLEFVAVRTMDEVVDAALVSSPDARSLPGGGLHPGGASGMGMQVS